MRKSIQKSSNCNLPESALEPTPIAAQAILIGIDWADKEHAFSAFLPSGKTKIGSFKQSKAGIDEWIVELVKLAPECNIDVCIETSSGALINALMEYSQVRIFPVNPLALANYRKAFAPGGGKNDPADARLIMQFLQHYRDQLRQLVPNSYDLEIKELVQKHPDYEIVKNLPGAPTKRTQESSQPWAMTELAMRMQSVCKLLPE